MAREATNKLTDAGVDGCFYYFDNNWHYLRSWHHLKKLKSAAPLPIRNFDYCPDYAAIETPQSDRIIARNISMLIKLSWTPTDLDQRIARMREVLRHL